MNEEVNSLIFGIRCNFLKQCGKERTEEAVKLIKELKRLARIGKATEKLLDITNTAEFTKYDKYGRKERRLEFESIEEMLFWSEESESN